MTLTESFENMLEKEGVESIRKRGKSRILKKESVKFGILMHEDTPEKPGTEGWWEVSPNVFNAMQERRDKGEIGNWGVVFLVGKSDKSSKKKSFRYGFFVKHENFKQITGPPTRKLKDRETWQLTETQLEKNSDRVEEFSEISEFLRLSGLD